MQLLPDAVFTEGLLDRMMSTLDIVTKQCHFEASNKNGISMLKKTLT